MRINRELRTVVEGEPAPDRNDEYRFYQALVGVWPAGDTSSVASEELVKRLQAYMIKAVKEAKFHSSWINPNEDYERALTSYIERALTGEGAAAFLPEFLPFQQRIARSGLANSLSQVVLKAGSPGVPDTYQGAELWDLSLVDPDNRRPVDYDGRRRALADVDRVLALPPKERADAIRGLFSRWPDGTIKLLVAAVALRTRRELEELFLDGDYLPLDTDLSVPARVVTFARIHADNRAAIIVAPALTSKIVDEERPLPIGERWKTSRILLPPSLAGLTFTDRITGAELRPATGSGGAWLFIGQVLSVAPVALLVA
jgi:(1->4)-alpha-D-glucan 1-alpha-D-glucosylmutase